MNTNLAKTSPETPRLTPQRRELLDFVAFEESTSAIWPWAVPAEAIRGDDGKLSAVEAMLAYDPRNGYDTDQMYGALDKVFGINPDLRKSISGTAS